MYFKFHRIIIHDTIKYYILKEKIMTSVCKGKVIIDDGETDETNHVRVRLDHKNDIILEILCLVVSPKNLGRCHHTTV